MNGTRFECDDNFMRPFHEHAILTHNGEDFPVHLSFICMFSKTAERIVIKFGVMV